MARAKLRPKLARFLRALRSLDRWATAHEIAREARVPARSVLQRRVWDELGVLVARGLAERRTVGQRGEWRAR